jgi:hypothetical protein
MVHTNKALAALALATFIASPVLAQDITPVDVNAVTCSGFMAMDTPTKRDVSYHVLNWINDSKNAVAAQKLIGKYGSSVYWTPEKLLIEIEGHCKDGAPDGGIVDRLMSHT